MLTFTEAVQTLLERPKEVPDEQSILDWIASAPEAVQKEFRKLEKEYGTVNAWIALGIAGLVPGGLLLSPAYLGAVGIGQSLLGDE